MDVSAVLKPQIRFLPHKRIKNDQAMLFYAIAASIVLFINFEAEHNTHLYKLLCDF